MKTFVNADWNGASRRFEIPRNHLAHFERASGSAAIMTLRRLVNNEWTVNDVASVIAYAIDGPDAVAKAAVARSERYGLPFASATDGEKSGEVEAAIMQHGPGHFADLAAAILNAAIFGDNSDGD